MRKSFERALVVGASSGIGAAFARCLAAEGATVALAARREDELAKVARGIETAWGEGRGRVFPYDVCRFAEAPAFVEHVDDALGGLDLVCYAAGVMPKIGPEDYDFGEDSRTLDVNLRGAVAVLNPVADLFGRRRKGTIVGIGSIAGDRGRRAWPAYHASKAGLATYLESLRNRLAQRGVQVTTIKPGFVDTPMTRGMKGLFWLRTADEAARMSLRAVAGGRSTKYVPARWGLVSLVIRSLPSVLFRRLDI